MAKLEDGTRRYGTSTGSRPRRVVFGYYSNHSGHSAFDLGRPKLAVRPVAKDKHVMPRMWRSIADDGAHDVPGLRVAMKFTLTGQEFHVSFTLRKWAAGMSPRWPSRNETMIQPGTATQHPRIVFSPR